MTSRKRKNSTSIIGPFGVNESNISDSSSPASGLRRSKRRTSKKQRDTRRRQLVEHLEQRQLLAGPQLIGIQPNEGELIVEGSVRDTAPRSLTFRFDENQQIDANTLDAIQIRRSGPDQAFGTADDVEITPGSVSLGALSDNEVVVRFADSLPDDRYRIDVFGFDSVGRGITGLRNIQGELLQPRDGVSDLEQIEFELRLGARVEAVVPQPVVRNPDRTLEQRRNEILVYFNDDELFVENDPATGEPTERSAENTRFYQLLLTQETVRTTDDVLYFPERVVYDATTNTSRLIFADDINQLPGVPLSGGTFRLRIGTAVDQASDLIIEPTQLDVVPRVSSNLGAAADLNVEFVSKIFGEAAGNRSVRFEDSGSGGLSVSIDPSNNQIVYDFGGVTVTVTQLVDVTRNTPEVDAVISISHSQGGVPDAGGSLELPSSLTDWAPLNLVAVGDTLTTATDIGVFGQNGSQLLSSIVISESIDAQAYGIQLPGALTDPGRNESFLKNAINSNFGPDQNDGITEIAYNFQGIFSGGVGTGLPAQLNNITETQKRRVREALTLWENYLGVQFRETQDSGITFALGALGELTSAPGATVRSEGVLDADLRIDPTFNAPAMVFSNQASFELNYGEDFFRKAMAGIGLILGLEQNLDVNAQTLMALDPDFLNATINPDAFTSPVDPFSPSQTRLQQKINPAVDSQTIDDPLPNSLTGQEPIFPGQQDILHGQLLHRPDSIDVDLYRFEVALDAGREFGTLTVESFAERLADSSLLDTSLTLFEDVSASAVTDFGLGSAVSVQVSSQLPGNLGNRSRIEFIQSDRVVGDTEIRIDRLTADNGELIANAIRVDMPRLGPAISLVSVQDVIDAVNSDPFASTLFELTQVEGSPNANLIEAPLSSYAPIRLSGGGTVELTRNDDYFSSDSLLTARLNNGVYYVGVAASGNDHYDPAVANSGFGGRTQGDYELLVKFEPQVSQTDVIRDRDSDRAGVPGTALDGDLDGRPSGVNNFWFQTRAEQRILQVVSDGSGIVAGQTMTITGADGASRRFEFIRGGTSPSAGNVPVVFSPGNTIADIATNLAAAINVNSGALGVTVTSQVDLLNPLAPATLTLSGERALAFSANFQGVEALGRNIFVDKVATVVADGSLDQPFNNVNGANGVGAFAAALPGDIVRIVGNGGQDNNIATAQDNFSYQFGIEEIGGGVLPDGRHMDVPKGVTTIVDAGAIFKMRSSTASVGSNNLLSNRSGGVLQVLGTPALLQISDPSPAGAANPSSGLLDLGASGNVVFTSTRDQTVDQGSSNTNQPPADGNWGGIIFRSDFDRREGRPNLEDEGIFLQVVNHADIRYGGGSNILINSVQQTVNPIQIVDLRPTITFNRLTNNASAAMSASPDAFLETRFQEPRFQAAGAFTADYSRVGPDIKQNLVVDNSINGLFIRTVTDVGSPARDITVAARIDDVDIVHFIAENILIAGRLGGPIQDGISPDVSSVTLQTTGGGQLADGDYQYRMTMVDASGFESLPSDPTLVITADANARRVQLLNLPLIADGSEYLTRRLYRSVPGSNEYRLIAELNRSSSTFVDDGSVTGGAVLDETREGVRGRLDGSLVIDPSSVIKFRGARIELDKSTQLLAEGVQGQQVVFTSALDDRFGAGGSFDTNEDAGTPGGGTDPSRGDWAGIYAGPTANISLDHAVVAYGGGVSLIEGGQSRGFAPLELQQADGRITNSRFEYNDHAQDGSGPVGRNGRLAVTPATIYARATQPVIVGNHFVDNHGSIIDIDLGSMTDELVVDAGRQSGDIDKLVGLDDNHGPLIRRNTTDSQPGDVAGLRQMNGLRVRGGELTVGSVWDDTDIAHVLFESVVVGNVVSSGGLTLKSRPNESLVVKMLGQGTPNSDTAGTGITVTGSTADISDRIGGTVHILGLPGSPVVLTSFNDDSVGAGRRSDGTAQNDTNGDGAGSRPNGNDWRSLFFDSLSNDRNTAVVLEQELSTAAPPGLNSTVENAQILGDLAERVTASDDRLRLGFEVDGFISGAGDIDTYAFTAAAGTQVWVDVDHTSLGLDTMIEVVDDLGRVIARSDDSFAEIGDSEDIDILSPGLLADSLADEDDPRTKRWANGQYYDVGSKNLNDAGLRITLPGVVGTRSNYFIRIRAASVDPGDIAGGESSGAYKFQLRLREEQEFPGSVVRHADIRYANHGIHVQGLPGSSPLLGEAQENESADVLSDEGRSQFTFIQPWTGGLGIDGEPLYPTDIYASNDVLNGGFFGGFNPFQPQVLNSRPQNLGDLVDSKTGTLSVGGELSGVSDVDFYQFDIDRTGSFGETRRSTIFDIDYAAGFDRPDTNISVFYSPTSNPNQAKLVLFGQSSNILDDQNSPLSTQLVGELLERGSISNDDAFIGPVGLPAGSYWVAVTEGSSVPTELLNNPSVRRTPIDSTVRIFDDHIEVNGGATADAPRYDQFVGSSTSGWTVTTNRDLDPGHDLPGLFSVESSIPQVSQVQTTRPSTVLDWAKSNTTIESIEDVHSGDPVPDLEAGQDFMPDTIILEFHDNVTGGARSSILAQHNLQITKQFQSIDAIVVETEPGANILQKVQDLFEHPEILYAEPDYIATIDAVPNDPQFGQQWHYNNVGQTFGTPDADIDLPEAWDLFTGSDQVVVAVIDTGMDLDHPDIVDNLWVNPGEIAGDGIDNDGNGYIDDVFGIDAVNADTDPEDGHGHGTHTGGTVGATGDNAIGISGVNQNVKIMPLKNCSDVGSCPTTASIEAIDYATMMRRDHGINIVASNNSYGGFGASLAMESAIRAHTNENILFVTSTGNNGLDIDVFPTFPASYDIDGIVSVAATDHNDQMAGFSNFGLGNVDLAAPGDVVLSLGLGGTYVFNSGTSMASPHVAGVAGLLAGYQPGLSIQDLKTAIMNGADPLPQLQGTSITGARLNAAGALAALPTGREDNESFFFDRSEDLGVLTSTEFDLLGYSAADLPQFYFDFYLAKASNDTVTVQAYSNEQPSPVALTGALDPSFDLNDPSVQNAWRQGVLDLSGFAGDTGIHIEFLYDTDLSQSAEGFYLDNFIVGFAERGELVSSASFGAGGFTAAASGVPGRYQLEMRPGTDYTENLDNGFVIERALAAAPNTIDRVYLTLNSGQGIIPYETFDINVLNTVSGLDELVTFQYVPALASLQNPALVDPNAVPVPYDRMDTVNEIGNRISLAISNLNDYVFFGSRRVTTIVSESFDTNDRHDNVMTLVAPSGDQIAEGSTFQLSDGSQTMTFEFDSDNQIGFGNVSIPRPASTAPASEVARSIIQVINSGVVQGALQLRASTTTGEWDFNNPAQPHPVPTDGRVALHGMAFGEFAAVKNVGSAPAPGTPLPVTDSGHLVLSAIFHDGVGDTNTERTQGQVIVENNQITEARAIGIWSDPGSRMVDPEDVRTIGSGTNYVRMPPVGPSLLGGVINFPEVNDVVEGGVAPGLVAQNNIIDRAGYTGVKIDGETRPFVLEWNDINFIYATGNTILQSPSDIMIADGFIFALDAGGTRVVFEFEDISGAPVNLGGSGQIGGDGFVDGHVPVYYRLGKGATYNPSLPDPVRSVGSSVHEIMLSIHESIQGSILVTNGLVDLVRSTLGPSLTATGAPVQQGIDADLIFPRPLSTDPNYLDFQTPAVYLEGVTGLYTSQAFQKQVGSGRSTMLNMDRQLAFNAFGMETITTQFDSTTGVITNDSFPMMPIAESPQPLAKLINNTIRGSDGTEGAILEDGTLSPAIEMPTDEPNDTIFNAVDTKLEVSHRGGYFASGTIGDNLNFLDADEDVDFFKVELSVGDRLIVDMNTNTNGPTTHLRVFDSSGIEVHVGQPGALPEYLTPGATVDGNNDGDTANGRDSFVDFTAPKKDTYYVGVSSAGNDNYEAKSLSERTEGTGGLGQYDIAIEVLAPRTFVFSLDNHTLDPFGAENLSGNLNGTYVSSGPGTGQGLIGTTFTISQIPDYLIPTRQGDAYAGVNADGNRVTFEFTGGVNRVVLANGNINVPILDGLVDTNGFRVPDIMRAISNAINGFLNNPALPNGEFGNGPDGRNGSVGRVVAHALGGSDGDNVGIGNMTRENGCFVDFAECPYGIFGSVDYPNGFGHDRRESGGTANVVPNGTLTDSRATTELYVFVENAAKIELSPEARAAGLKLGPDNTGLVNPRLGNISYASESDQLLAEQGIHIGSGASASILNNVVVNAHQSLVREESSAFGFGGRIDELNPDLSPKKGNVVAAGNTFQYDDHRNSQIRSDVSWWIGFGGFVNTNFALDGSLSTDLRTGPSNVAGGNSDFNFVVRQPGTPGQVPGNFVSFVGDDLLEDGAAGRFTPAENAGIIDSAVDSIDPLVDLVSLNAQLGIPTRLISAPERDFSGQLRADEPTMAPPFGIGANVFKDRGALDRADFVGPNATLDTPQDNDFAKSDFDPEMSFVNRQNGIFTEFRVLIQDLGDDSNPFVGSGIDDTTIIVPPIEGLRSRGANITLFENERLLQEGIDYSFSYDETAGIITLKSLAGVWRNDRSYRIQLNNRDRTVLLAPDANTVFDGDQISVIDANGGQLIFEFETGYLVQMPEPITVEVPIAGTNQGGLIDGGVFTIDDGVNPVVVFELDSNDTTVPGSIPVPLPDSLTPIDPAVREQFLIDITETIVDVIQQTIDDPGVNLNIDVRSEGTQIIISSELNTRLDVSTSGLVAASRTVGLQVPVAGADVGGVIVGETFEIFDGISTQVFEYVNAGNPNPVAGRIAVDISPVGGTPLSPVEVANQMIAAIESSGLKLNPNLVGRTVHLNLPPEGTADVPSGRLRPVSVSRTPGDGDLITFTPAGGTDVVFEVNRTDERDVNGAIVNDGVAPGNIAINITRGMTGDEMAQVFEAAIESQGIAGVDNDELAPVGRGILRVGGDVGLGMSVNSATIELSGTPGVTGASTLEVFGPLLLEVPFTAPADGDQFSVLDDNGNGVLFEFDSNNVLASPGAVQVQFQQFDDQATITAAVAAAINGAGTGLTATDLGAGVIALGRVGTARVDVMTSSLTTRRGIVSDGETLTITQGGFSVTYEFESITNGGGVFGQNIPVPFQTNGTPADVAASLAAAISSNSGGLVLNPTVTPEGLVELNDIPGTVVQTVGAPSLILTGVPGGARAIDISPDDTLFDVNQSLLRALNSVNSGTALLATDRGGGTLFVENARLIEGPVKSFFLPAIKDLSGNPLSANRDNNSTQFTMLLPTVSLDYGDAPDPRGLVAGQYPTLLENNGARHVIGDSLMLGVRVDAEPDAQVTTNADGDDLIISAVESGELFVTALGNGFAEVIVQTNVDPLQRDGDTVTLSLADRSVTLEFDVDGIFAEENFAISPIDPSSVASITAAIEAAINQTDLHPGEIRIVGERVEVYSDDEDGVSFVSDINPNGNLSKGLATPVSVTVTGAGILQAWIDFNADGDWDDPGELVIDGATDPNAVFSEDGKTVTRVFDVSVPDFASPPPVATSTYARFRVSREGGLDPEGLALSGEVEDYRVALVPGSPPELQGGDVNREYTVLEDGALFVLDQDGQFTTTPSDDGLLRGIVDPDGDFVGIYRDDVGIRTLMTDSGEVAGELDLSADGTFTFIPVAEFNGTVSFTARVTDIIPSRPETELVNQTPITVNIEVLAVNDKPFATQTDVITEVTIDEDAVTIFTAEDLIDPFYLPGPANESDQALVFRSVSSPVLGDAVSNLGGILEILPDGRSIRYTPPQDYNGDQKDSFNFIVADVISGNLVARSADKPGTVSITIDPVNDAPIAGADFYTAMEDTNLSIAINGGGSIVGILDNDSPGPQNEIDPPENQTIELPTDQFPLTTQRGGTVRFSNGQLVYTPPGLYSGPDGFQYRVVDSEGAASFGTVSIDVGGQNNQPRFEGVNGVKDNLGNPVDEITVAESKPNDQSDEYNLSTWFSDPENDTLTYSVVSSNEAIVSVDVQGSLLTLTRPKFAFGTVTLTVTATDTGQLSTTETIEMTIVNENDSPELENELTVETIDEDQQLFRQMSTVFSDPDGDALTYTVSKLGSIVRPSAQEIANHPLIESIVFDGDLLTITPKPDQFGSVDIEIEATDGEFRVADAFTLQVLSQPDAPVAEGDTYNVAVGSTLQVLNPANGLLRNDSDADGDNIVVDVNSITPPTRGTLQVNPDGTFVYTNTSGQIGLTDAFSYRVMDVPASGSSRFSEFRTVQLNLTQSQYQNPIPGREEDVNADGFISPIDALLVINLLSRRSPPSGALPVSEIGTVPPDYYDTDGNGSVSPLDALKVINRLAAMANGAEGELVSDVLSASTTSFVAPTAAFLPTSNVEKAEAEWTEPVMTVADSTDALFSAGVSIEASPASLESDLIAEPASGINEGSVDELMSDLLGDWDGGLDG